MRFLDGGRFIALLYLFTPFYSPVFNSRESGGVIYHYRMGYVFGIRIFKYQLMHSINEAIE